MSRHLSFNTTNLSPESGSPARWQAAAWAFSLLLALGACSADDNSSDPADLGSDIPSAADLAEETGSPDADQELAGQDVAPDLFTPPPDPIDPGPHQIIEAQFELPVGQDGIVVPLDIALPDAPGPFPVIVFTHGFALKASFYQTYKNHLASWGFVAILPTMPGTAFSPKTHDELAAYIMAIMDWVQETSDDPQGPLMGKAAPDNFGLSGHSMGGKVSLLVASKDPRVAASFTLDPVDSASPMGDQTGFPSVTPELMPLISIPLAFAGETLDGTPPEGSKQSCAPADQNFEQYFLHAQAPAFKFDFPGANHMSFLDSADCGIFCAVCQKATTDTDKVRDLSQRYMIAFYNTYLKDEAEYEYWFSGDGLQTEVESGFVTFEAK